MKHICHAILLLAAAALAYSCDSERSARLLATADSLLIHKPYEARAMLVADSEAICSGGKAARMGYALARTEANDKCFAIHTSDSAMLEAAEYYNRRDDALAATRAWYLLGRVYCDMRFYSSALSAFENAAKAKAAGNPRIAHYQSLAYTWTASIYEEKELYGKALHYNIKAYELAKRSGDASTAVYSLRDIGRDYSSMNKNRVAIRYYLRAASLAKKQADKYLYNMVMEELAAIYLEEGMTKEAKDALSTPFDGKQDIDLSTHYFTWATYYDSLGIADSAIHYTNLGIKHSDEDIACDAIRDLATIYKKKKDYKTSSELYEKYIFKSDSLGDGKIAENKDFIYNIEQNIVSERKNAELVSQRNRLYILIAAAFIIVAATVFAAIRIYNRREKTFRLRRERAEQDSAMQHEKDKAIILHNAEKIRQLEKELEVADTKISEIKKQLISSEMEMLSRQNETMLSEQKHNDLLIKDFKRSDIYQFYHNQTSMPGNNDFRMLQDALDKTYNRFTFRLKELYPAMRFEELYVCCLVKAGLDPKRIRIILGHDSASYISMLKVRLYKKIFNMKVSVAEFDAFIRKF